MPVSPTYPGVYVEEIPSGVHTISGVSTSITAFVGYTARGAVDEAVHIFSFADFERAFGGLAVDSPLSYCVKHFFQNGGSDAYVVRVAQGAGPARVSLQNANAAGVDVLDVTTASAGTWGNNVQLDVDYDTSNPASLFNLKVTEFIEQNGQMVPGRSETFRNLSMNSFDSSYAINTINAGSELIHVTRPGIVFAGNGTNRSGPVTLAMLDRLYVAPDRLSRNRVAFLLDGTGPLEFNLFTGATPLNPANVTLDTRLAEIAGRLQTEIIKLTAPASVTVTHTPGDDFIVATSQNVLDPLHIERSAIQFVNASRNDAVDTLRLSAAGGAVEADAAGTFRPARTGTVAIVPAGALALLAPTAAIHIDVMHGSDPTPLNGAAPIVLSLWGAGTGPPPLAQPTTLADVLAAFRGALARSAEALLGGASASLVGGALRLAPGPADANNWFRVTNAGGGDTTAAQLGFTAANIENLARYAPGAGVALFAQTGVIAGSNGTAPGGAALIGSEAAKTGLYALENVDIFNLLVMPDTAATVGVLTEAIAYCARRRAFMIIDAPDTLSGFAQAQTWIGSAASPLRSRNSALYFPRLREPDPLRNGIVGTFPAAGALAGLYARTDAERGVWKAPAGTSATIVGATGLTTTLTDLENGVLNPAGLNCLRTFPVYGTVSWGARTARGADALADEYKYIPVRRLALFLEESLYRGTQWAVFEPNDEPLWAQIRLNLGAFMHTLFAQGAFQGRTPRDAYFVKCDKETTTQNDIDLGRVNIVVGFAPLKPAEFVIIQIQQIAGQLQT